MKRKIEVKRNVPRLRFPEFQDAGDWEKNLLGSLGEFTGGGTPSKLNDSYWQGNKPWISSSDISDDSIYEINISRFISDVAIRETATKIVPANSILLVSRVGVGKLAVTKSQICTSQDFTNFTPYKDDLIFIAYYLKTLKRNFISLNQGMAIKGFTKDDVSNLLLSLPSLPEQQKIADCLSSIDELISIQAQKLDALKSHKKGLLQQLFPAEGETVPRLRFPEFRGAGEWEERNAGTLFENRVEDGEDGLPIYSVTINDGMVKRSAIERKVDDIAESEGNKKAYKDDIAYNMMRMWQGAFGVSKEDCMVSPAYIVLSPSREAWPNFFGYLFKLQKYLKLLTSHSQGLTQDRLRLYYKDFAKISILIPSLSEQQKIADCLSSIDELISIQAQKLDALKSHKKGLLQQLFPEMRES
ncbi:restriction endonuclease subunit S [Leptospira interrogans]|uniref:restriction endonuclease subunit S n=1 Tax=Leptospira interrogans TaxID=173 RepID=UPI0007747D49|nr:restriction endonuclease subunit S [Leptospira interrogans]